MFRVLILVVLPLLVAVTPLFAQLPPKEVRSGVEMVKLTDNISLPTLGVENQSQSGTCWSFGVTAVLESDIIAKGGKADNLSDMWIVRNIYFDKVVKYVRLHGKNVLSVGGAMHDVIECIKRYGVVPEEVYPGLEYGTEYDFAEIDAVMKAYADAIISAERPSAVWERGLNMLLDNYFGARVASFEWHGKTYTPLSYADSMPLDMDDYVSVTSFAHHPYNKFVALELPDNWLWQQAYNIPIDELMKIMDSVLERGRSFGLAVDITESGFYPFNGVAVVEDSASELKSFDWSYIQRRRQLEFDRYITTDDHCLQIMGRATDKDGNVYYKAKNSWGKIGPYNGFFYLSKEYVAQKMILIMVDRNLLPSKIKNNLGVK
ncbi:MAG: C1 family peptidase [Rikenellaceae bacterium]